MLQHVTFGLYVFATGLVMALLEVQIEGAAGWAGNLPTWRFDNRVTRAIFGGRPLTGYHLYFHVLILTLLHLPYALGFTGPSLSAELRILAFLVLFWLIEDWLWFVVNPAYGWGQFRADRILWHRHSWWLIMPREYWFALPGGLFLYCLGLIL